MIGVAVVGAGNWGRNLVRNFASARGAALKYVVDLSEKTRKQIAAQYPSAVATDSLDTVLKDPSVQAVVIAVDAPNHFTVAK